VSEDVVHSGLVCDFDSLERGLEVVFCDNRVVSLGGDGSFDELALATTDLAVERHHP